MQTHVEGIETILLNNISESKSVIRNYKSWPRNKCGLKLYAIELNQW